MAQRKGLGDLEQQVMELLWQNGPATGDVVRAAVSKDRSLTDSTIRTVPRRLEAKQFIKHEMDGRKFIYSSSRERSKAAAAPRGLRDSDPASGERHKRLRCFRVRRGRGSIGNSGACHPAGKGFRTDRTWDDGALVLPHRCARDGSLARNGMDDAGASHV